MSHLRQNPGVVLEPTFCQRQLAMVLPLTLSWIHLLLPLSVRTFTGRLAVPSTDSGVVPCEVSHVSGTSGWVMLSMLFIFHVTWFYNLFFLQTCQASAETQASCSFLCLECSLPNLLLPSFLSYRSQVKCLPLSEDFPGHLVNINVIWLFSLQPVDYFF